MDSDVPSSRELFDENSWTDEKHVHFLNAMEQSFVRAMFENNNVGRRLLRLDRYLPDTSDSTLDLKPQRSKKHGISDDLLCKRGRGDRRAEKRSRRVMSSQPLISSQDQNDMMDWKCPQQVVPQFETRTGGDKDERDHQNVPVAPAN